MEKTVRRDRGMFATKTACEQRERSPTRQDMYEREDMMSDRVAIETRLRIEMGSHRRGDGVDTRATLCSGAEATALCGQLFGIAEGYRRLNTGQSRIEGVINTFRYIYDRHQRGVYVSIRDGRVACFVGFHKRKDWRNPLARHMRLDPDAKRVAALRYAKDGIDPSDVTYNPPWLWNNIGCLVGSVANVRRDPQAEQTGYEASYNHSEVRFFLDRVCEAAPAGRVPDCDFFVNYYDQVLLRKDLTVPLWHIVGRQATSPPHTGARGPMAPIVSMCTRPGFIDIPCVFPDDVARAWGVYGAPRCSNGYGDEASYEQVWSKKQPQAVFRGSATGCGWTTETNARMRLAQLSTATAAGRSAVDAVLTYGSDTVHFKKHVSEPFVRYRTVLQEPDKVLTLTEQSRYRYVVYIEGNVAAYRMSAMFSLGSMVIYVVGDDYRGWFHPLLRHLGNCYVVKDADGVIAAVEWARANDADAERIAAAGLEMYRRHLGRAALLEYGTKMLSAIDYAVGGADVSDTAATVATVATVAPSPSPSPSPGPVSAAPPRRRVTAPPARRVTAPPARRVTDATS